MKLNISVLDNILLIFNVKSIFTEKPKHFAYAKIYSSG